MIDIIVPVLNQPALTTACLRSIEEHTLDYRLIYVDNGSDAILQAELDRHPHILVRHHRNMGFIKAVNAGLTLATAEYIVLLNNDTEVVPGWMDKLKAPLLADSSIAAVGPLTTAVDCWQGKEQLQEGWRVLPKSAMLAFFCVMFRRSAVEQVGLLDEAFGVGLADDDDYCMRLKKAGFLLALAHNLVIPHHHRSTFKLLYSDEEIERMTEDGRAMYKRKHGVKK